MQIAKRRLSAQQRNGGKRGRRHQHRITASVRKRSIDPVNVNRLFSFLFSLALSLFCARNCALCQKLDDMTFFSMDDEGDDTGDSLDIKPPQQQQRYQRDKVKKSSSDGSERRKHSKEHRSTADEHHHNNHHHHQHHQHRHHRTIGDPQLEAATHHGSSRSGLSSHSHSRTRDPEHQRTSGEHRSSGGSHRRNSGNSSGVVDYHRDSRSERNHG